jgi:hypothetical protein
MVSSLPAPTSSSVHEARTRQPPRLKLAPPPWPCLGSPRRRSRYPTPTHRPGVRPNHGSWFREALSAGTTSPLRGLRLRGRPCRFARGSRGPHVLRTSRGSLEVGPRSGAGVGDDPLTGLGRPRSRAWLGSIPQTRAGSSGFRREGRRAREADVASFASRRRAEQVIHRWKEYTKGRDHTDRGRTPRPADALLEALTL